MSAVADEQIFHGLRVVDLSTGMAGPLASMVLADHGADVVKIEPPGGEWARALPAFVQWNRGKRSVEIDLDADDDRAVVRELVTTADVVIASDAGRALDAVDAPRDLPARSGLITCSITGFGPYSGPAGMRPYEGVVAAFTGRMSGLDRLSGGHPGKHYDEPAFTAAPVASFGASQLALQGIVAALLQRLRTGRGQHVSTSLLQGAAAFVMRQELGRGDMRETATIAPAVQRGIELCFLTAECADGRYIQMCARQDHHFQNWLRAVGLAHLLDEPQYRSAPMGIASVADVEELEVQLRDRMRHRTQADWMRVFTEEYDVGADPFLTPREFLAHPDMLANDRVVEIDDPVLGTIRQLGPLIHVETSRARIERSAPALGASNLEVRSGALWLAAKEPLPVVLDHDQPLDGPDDQDGESPLAGVTILEVAYYIAGPFATALLAELGARVIKVEPLEGDPYRRTGLQSAKFMHGKESITLDLKHPDGRTILGRLVDGCDVVVHSFRNTAAERFGLDAPSVFARNPHAVHLYAASYGSRGPQRDRAAFHSTPNALTGGGIKQAGAGNPPVNDSYADPGSALAAATAILFGLWARERTGRGQVLETTMLASAGYIHSADMVVFEGAAEPVIADADQRGLSPRYRLYECADGHIFVAAVQAVEWRALVDTLSVRECEDAPDEVAAGILERRFRTRTAAEWSSLLMRAGVGVATVSSQTFDAWLESEGLLTAESHAAYGSYWRLPAKLGLSGSPPVRAPACGAGEQSAGLLAELGYGADAIESWFRSGVSSDGRQPGGTSAVTDPVNA